MISSKQDERGVGHLETVLIVVVVAIIGFVGWYVYHTKQNADQALNTASSTTSGASPRFAAKNKNGATSGTSNTELQTDLQAASSAANQGSKDISTTNSSLSDQSTFASVPQ